MLKADITESQQGPFFHKTLTSTWTQEFEHVQAGQDVQTYSTGGPYGFDPASVSLELLRNFLTCHEHATSSCTSCTMHGKSAPRLLLHGLVVFNIELLVRSALILGSCGCFQGMNWFEQKFAPKKTTTKKHHLIDSHWTVTLGISSSTLATSIFIPHWLPEENHAVHSAHQHFSICFRTFPTRPNADSMHATTNIYQGQPVTNAGSRCLDQIGCNILTTKSTEPTQSKTELSCMSSKPPSKRRPRISLFGLRCGASRISIVKRYVNGPSLTCRLKQLPLDVEQLQNAPNFERIQLEHVGDLNAAFSASESLFQFCPTPAPLLRCGAKGEQCVIKFLAKDLHFGAVLRSGSGVGVSVIV